MVSNASVHLASLVLGARETSTSVFPILAQFLVLKTASSSSTTIIAIVNQDIWEDTVMQKSTSALILLVKTEVFVQLFQEATNVYATMDSMAKTANIPAMLVILTLAKTVAIAERLK